MGEFDLGKYFKSRIQNHSEEIDTDAIWNSLDLDNEKKRRPKMFWLFGLSLFMLLGIGAVSIYNIQASKIQNLEKEISEAALASKQGSILKTSHMDDLGKPNEIVNNKKLSSDSENVENTNVDSNTDQETNTIALTTNFQTNNSISNNAITTNVLESQPKEIFNHTTTSIYSQDVTNQINNITSSSAINTSASVTTKSSTTIPATTSSFLNSSRADVPVPNRKEDPLSFNPLAILPIPLLNYSDRLEALALHKIKVVHPIVRNNGRLYVGLYSGYNVIDRTLSSTQSGESDPLLMARNSTESILEMITGGLDLKFKLHSNWYVKSGLEFQSIIEKFAYALNSIDTTLEENLVIEQFVSAQSDTTDITGSGMVQQPFSENWVNYNSHRMHNIPISVGYQFSNNRRWNFYVEGSFILNFSRNFEGLQLSTNLNVVDQPRYFTNALNTGYALSAGIAYNPAPRFNIYLQPRYQKMLGSFTNREDGISQHYQMYGMRLGMSYLLN